MVTTLAVIVVAWPKSRADSIRLLSDLESYTNMGQNCVDKTIF